jgi:hypothetical protein
MERNQTVDHKETKHNLDFTECSRYNVINDCILPAMEMRL